MIKKKQFRLDLITINYIYNNKKWKLRNYHFSEQTKI